MERNSSIDIARGLAMVLVIVGHALEMFFNRELSPSLGFNDQSYEIYRAIFSFHMPAFFFISGMVLRSPQTKPRMKVLTESLTLVALALATHILGSAIAYIAGVERFGTVRALIHPFVTGGQGLSLRVTWFLISLAIVQVLAHLFLRVSIIGRILIAAGIVAWSAAAIRFNVFWFNGQTIAAGFVFYLGGYYFSQMRTRSLSMPVVVTLALAAMFIWLATYSLNSGCSFAYSGLCNNSDKPSFAVIVIGGRFGFIPLFLLTAFSGTLFLLLLSEIISRGGRTGLLEYVGRNTLPLLVLNGVCLAMIEPRLSEALMPFATYWAVIVVLITAIHLILLPLIAPAVALLRQTCARVISDALNWTLRYPLAVQILG